MASIWGKALTARRFFPAGERDYSDPAGTGVTELLNQASTAAARAYGAVVADVFTFLQGRELVVAGGVYRRPGGGPGPARGITHSPVRLRSYILSGESWVAT